MMKKIMHHLLQLKLFDDSFIKCPLYMSDSENEKYLILIYSLS